MLDYIIVQICNFAKSNNYVPSSRFNLWLLLQSFPGLEHFVSLSLWWHSRIAQFSQGHTADKVHSPTCFGLCGHHLALLVGDIVRTRTPAPSTYASSLLCFQFIKKHSVSIRILFQLGRNSTQHPTCVPECFLN